MFEDVELYLRDLKNYYDGIQEFNLNGVDQNDKKRTDFDSKFKDKIRKYLPSALNIVNTKYNCKFSLYKEGQDYSSSFKVIPTKVKKTKNEVINELMGFEQNSNLKDLNPNDKRQLSLALEILIVYSDDNFQNDIGQSKFLEEAKALPSDKINYDNNIQEEPNLIPTSTEIQYNPYAGQPVNIENDYSKQIDTNSFNANISELKPLENNPVENTDNSEYAYNDVIDGSSLSIFGSNPNNNQ